MQLVCPPDLTGDCDGKTWQNFDLEPTVTDYLEMEFTEVCDPPAGIAVGLTSVRVWANNGRTVIDCNGIHMHLIERWMSMLITSSYYRYIRVNYSSSGKDIKRLHLFSSIN